MYFNDLFQDLAVLCNTPAAEFNNLRRTENETFGGEHTEQLFTNLRYGEPLDNIRCTAKVSIK